MSLSERLDAIRAGAAKQIPEPAREVMQRATQALEDSGLARRGALRRGQCGLHAPA